MTKLQSAPDQSPATANRRSHLIGLPLLLLLAVSWASVVQAQYSYTMENAGITITDYSGPGGDVAIPATLGGFWVQAIGDDAFRNKTNVTSVKIPGSVISIGVGAFTDCSGLTGITVDSENAIYASKDGVLFSKGNSDLLVYPAAKLGPYTIPNGVTSIADESFRDCTGLTSVTIPNSVTSIGGSSFAGCSGLISMSLPKSMNSIGESAFFGCTRLISITIPNGVTTISSSTFYGCTDLASVSIPNSVTSIGEEAFRGCTGLTDVSIPDSVTDIGDYAFYGCTGLGGMTIPESVTDIGWYTFFGCTGLTNVAIPDSVTSIGNLAFYGCTRLASVTIPNDVTTVGGYTFYGCTGLTNVTIPGGVTSINWYAFAGCTALSSVTIPNGVTSIGWSAFKNCTGLTNVTISNGVTEVGVMAFKNCTGLISVTIPESLSSIRARAFEGCTGLTAFTVDAGNSVYASLDGVLFSKNMSALIIYPASKSGAYTIPDGVASISQVAFEGCTGLTGVEIPSSTTAIGVFAFRGCTGLASIMVNPDNSVYASLDGVLFSKTISALILYPPAKSGGYTVPDGVASIRVFAFDGCTGLTSVSIPKSTISISSLAFRGCTALAEILLDPANTKYASLEGVVFSKNMSMLTTYPPARLGAYTIPDSVDSIGDEAFFGCIGLTSVSIPRGVTSIGSNSFRGCIQLSRAIFWGNAPVGRSGLRDTRATVFYQEGTTGWDTTFDGRPTMQWSTRVVLEDGHLRVLWGHFTFNIEGAPGRSVVVEACEQLSQPHWLPVSTNIFNADGLTQFIDPSPADSRGRMYRINEP